MKCFSRHTWARKRFEESIAIIGEPALPGPRCNQHLPWIITSQVFYEMKIRFYITEAHKKYAIRYPVIILFVWKFVYMYFCIDKLYLLFQSYLNQNQIRIRTNNNDMIFFPLNSDTNWLSSSAYSQVPVRAEIFGMKQQDGASPYQFHHIYDYTDFTTTLDPLTTVFEVFATTLLSFEFQNMSNAFDNLSSL